MAVEKPSMMTAGGVEPERAVTGAGERLAIDSASSRDEQLEAFKRFLKLETERLRMRHRMGLGGLEVASGRSHLADLVVARACQIAAEGLGAETIASLRANCALVALGGYGRRELAPQSDVDVLFLYGDFSESVARFVEQALLLLWDIGLVVGHSFRSVEDCVTMAARDPQTRRSLAESRLVAGSGPLLERLNAALQEHVYSSRPQRDAFLEALKLEHEERYVAHGRTVCLQEPDVKQGAGGLRDLHTVLWVAHAAYGCRDFDALRALDSVSARELSQARRSYDFVSRVRNELHFSTGERTDVLSLDRQPLVAAGLGYKPRPGLEPSEAFMREHYHHANELHAFCESFLWRAWGAPKTGGGARRARKVGLFEIRDGQLQLPKDGAGLDSAARLLEVFSITQERNVAPSDELRLAVRSHLRLVDRTFRASRAASDALLEMLRRPGRVAGSLRLMHDSGFLGRLLPEFRPITFLVQHDSYHRYTIDEHTLKALEAVDTVAQGREPDLARFQRVLGQIPDPATLYLGLLLHDVGKGGGGEHVANSVRLAERACARLKLDPAMADDVVFVVRQHLLMSQVSQRRDLAEERVIDSFVATVGSALRLDLLLLVTYADTVAVGPGVWNEWKATVLWELYNQARARLAARKPSGAAAETPERLRERTVQELLAEFAPAVAEEHLTLMPERYLRAAEPRQIASHLRLVERLGERPLAADWRPGRHYTDLTLCARDRPGLLALIAGTLSAHGLDILSVDVYTRADGIALDTFRLSIIGSAQPVGPERWPGVEVSLVGALEGDFDVARAVDVRVAKEKPRPKKARVVPNAVRFDSDGSASATIVEVRASDQPGLVYRIAHTLATLGLNIVFAKIATEKSQALDIFYVTADGGKLDEARMAATACALLEALEGGLTPARGE